MRTILAPLWRGGDPVTCAVVRAGWALHVLPSLAFVPRPRSGHVAAPSTGAMLAGVAIIPIVAINRSEDVAANFLKVPVIARPVLARPVFAGLGFSFVQSCKRICRAVVR